ncbi:MAG: porin, LamB type, partial [Edaphobacter sp.]|nr:porin, LamB type [Edaphobacter sp.]
NPQHDWNQWLSFGARPEVFFNKYISLAFEGGFDHTHSVGQYDDWLRKVTIAPKAERAQSSSADRYCAHS